MLVALKGIAIQLFFKSPHFVRMHHGYPLCVEVLEFLKCALEPLNRLCHM